MTEKQELEGKLREKVTIVARRFIGPGLISAADAAPLLELSRVQLDRYLGDNRIYLIPLKKCDHFEKFFELAEACQELAISMITRWKALSRKSFMEKMFSQIVYNRKIRKILDTGRYSFDTKTNLIVAAIFESWAEKINITSEGL